MVRPPFVDSNGMKKGAWSEEEDNKLRDYIQIYGHRNWRLLPGYAGLARCGKSCRLRWVNYLKPGLKRGNFTKQEEELIIQLHDQLGNKWSAIASKLTGRTDNEIKNFWHTGVDKRRKRNAAAKSVKGLHTDKSKSSDHVTPCKTTRNGNESSSLDAIKPQHSAPSLDANPLLLSVTEPLPEEDFSYSELINYNRLSSSYSPDYLSALDWINADDDQNVLIMLLNRSRGVTACSDQSFSSNISNSQSENISYVSPHEVGEFYDPLLQYFDHWNEFV